MFRIHGSAVDIVVAKAESGEHWPRLTKESSKFHWLSVDWNKWIDESDEEGDAMDFGDMGSFSDFADDMDDGKLLMKIPKLSQTE